jgi:hypothetical protein
VRRADVIRYYIRNPAAAEATLSAARRRASETRQNVEQPSPCPCLVAAVPELMFASRLCAAGQALGVAVRAARSRDELLDAARQCSGVIVEMTLEWDDPAALIALLKSSTPAKPVLAFFPHVQTELKRAAQAAGADRIAPRSQFERAMRDFFAEVFAPRRRAADDGPGEANAD